MAQLEEISESGGHVGGGAVDEDPLPEDTSKGLGDLPVEQGRRHVIGEFRMGPEKVAKVILITVIWNSCCSHC